VFDEPRVTNLIETIKPHVYAKGGDYTVDSLNREERGALDFVGAEIEILGLVPGRSTTRTIQSLAAAERLGPEAPKKQLRIAVLGSGEGSNLDAVMKAISGGELHAEVVCVISDVKECGVLRRARAADVPHFFVDPGSNPKRFGDAAQKEVVEHLHRAGADLVLLLGFMRLLRGPVLELFADRIWNLHPSLLPAYKGSHAVQRALEEGELEAGSSLHLVTAELDAGRVLAQRRVRIEIGDSVESLTARIKAAEHGMLVEALVATAGGSSL
jgi:formyltetrahydrofolate-dependent phosphoribosylglycinamide formyltransferase